MFRKKNLMIIGSYAGAVILCLLILTWVMKLWNANLNIPFGYSGDSLSSGMIIKGIIDNGWYLNNKFVGMPTGSGLYDFPMTDNFHFLILKVMSFFTSDYGLVINLFFLLTFPLTTLTSLFVFRHFKISHINSIVGSLLFAFLPYHFFRGESHLFLAAYYMIPLIVMVVLWVYSENLSFFHFEENKIKSVSLDYKSVTSIVICILVASTGVYYAFFGCFFILVAGVSTYIRQRKFNQLLASVILIAIIAVGVSINVSPSIIYRNNYGVNTEAARRDPAESEAYGLKIDQLLLPVTGHRLSHNANVKADYNDRAPLVNENDFSSLGIIGSFCFLFLIGWIFVRKSYGLDNLYNNLSELNASAVLLATVGGFGSVFAFLVSPQIRGYNRISVFIGFFSFFVLGLLLDRLASYYFKSKTSRVFYYVLPVLILLVGILDQTNSNHIPAYANIKNEYTNDANFVRTIETLVPPNSMIFQLPYVPFPENPPVQNMTDYDLFKGYLHSNTLRWSYGVVRGREGDLWQKEVSAKPVGEFVQTLSSAGFNGIYLDRNGYADKGKEVESKLTKLLGIKPLISSNKRLVFFNMVEYNKKLKL